mmetsp:Transcript_7555/g.13962  ORF Transcript_7555/g.13962 Transcript_7555/m.13962 type:complete len:86 (+) Transcript_7555:547-804(+)
MVRDVQEMAEGTRNRHCKGYLHENPRTSDDWKRERIVGYFCFYVEAPLALKRTSWTQAFVDSRSDGRRLIALCDLNHISGKGQQL